MGRPKRNATHLKRTPQPRVPDPARRQSTARPSIWRSDLLRVRSPRNAYAERTRATGGEPGKNIPKSRRPADERPPPRGSPAWRALGDGRQKGRNSAALARALLCQLSPLYIFLRNLLPGTPFRPAGILRKAVFSIFAELAWRFLEIPVSPEVFNFHGYITRG